MQRLRGLGTSLGAIGHQLIADAILLISACNIILLLTVPAGAASQDVTITPNFSLAAVSAINWFTQGCTRCDGSFEPLDPMLRLVFYYEDPKNIKTVPRTSSGSGSAGELGLAGVGMIGVPGPKGGIATGFLISPCHVLTNHHVVFANDREHPSSAISVNFYYGQGQYDGFAAHVSATPVDHPESVGHGWGMPNNAFGSHYGDWAVLRLKTCVGSELGFLTLLPANFSENVLSGTFGIAGVLKNPQPNNRNYRDGLDVDTSCNVMGYGYLDGINGIINPNIIQHFCASAPGASGAPIYLRVKGKPMVVAINLGSTGIFKDQGGVYPKDGTTRNLAIPIRAIYDRLFNSLKPEEGYVKDQTGQNWHFGDDLRLIMSKTPEGGR